MKNPPHKYKILNNKCFFFFYWTGGWCSGKWIGSNIVILNFTPPTSVTFSVPERILSNIHTHSHSHECAGSSSRFAYLAHVHFGMQAGKQSCCVRRNLWRLCAAIIQTPSSANIIISKPWQFLKKVIIKMCMLI